MQALDRGRHFKNLKKFLYKIIFEIQVLKKFKSIIELILFPACYLDTVLDPLDLTGEKIVGSSVNKK